MSNVDNEAANFDNPLLNPLLRRESLSIVNRRRLEEANMMNDNVEKVMKLKEQCSQQFFAFIWLVLCNYIPSLWGGFRNPECGMPIRKANNYFAAMTSLTLIPMFIILLGYVYKLKKGVSALRIREWLQKAEIV